MAFRKGNKSNQPADPPVQFRHSDAQRIVNTVHAYETSRKGRKPSTLPRSSGSGGGGVEEAYFTGGWLKRSIKQITFSADTSSTAQAINLIRSIPVTGNVTARLCTVSLRSVTTESEVQQYVLINAEC